MSVREIKDFIRQQANQGYGKEYIRQNLQASGYSDKKILKAFNEYGSIRSGNVKLTKQVDKEAKKAPTLEDMAQEFLTKGFIPPSVKAAIKSREKLEEMGSVSSQNQSVNVQRSARKEKNAKKRARLDLLTPEQKKYVSTWSLGAFFGGWFWALVNRMYVMAISMFAVGWMPVIGPFIYFWLALTLAKNGRELSWTTVEWQSFDEFKARQKMFIVLFITLSILIAVGIALNNEWVMKFGEFVENKNNPI